ncbi:MAG: prolyl oligopeptidase family serine peptidase [Tepidisphaeraceae bacterium]
MKFLLTLLLMLPTTAPALHRDDIVDDYHGTKIADPFRWLETPDSPATRAFIEQQDAITRNQLATPLRDELRKRLDEIVNYPRVATPTRYGKGRLIYSRNSGLQAQSPVVVQDGLTGEPRVLFDPNTFSADGTVALSSTSYTDDGTRCAYGISDGGSDEQTIKFRSVDTGDDLPDTLTQMRFSSIAWLPGDKAVLYNKYPDPTQRLNSTLYIHPLGTQQSEDFKLFAHPTNPEISLYPSVSRDGKWVLIYESLGTDPRNGLLVSSPNLPRTYDGLKRVVEPGVCEIRPIENDGDTLYAVVDREAPKRKLVAINLKAKSIDTWKTIIPESEDTIESVELIHEQFVVTYKHDAASLIVIFDKQGNKLREVPLPTVGTAWVSGRREDKVMFLGFTSYTYPTTIYTYDMETGETKPWFESKVNFNPADFETKQVFVTSKDGTRVPMFVTHKKGLPLDGSNPTLLYGYGGFNVGMAPFFSAINIAWLERGGIYAVACIRGGDEYGSAWHEAGMLDRKQNVFDDFCAAGEELVKLGYTSPKKLAIEGGSNGGLLVAACMLQRPSDFGAVVCQVGVLDMLRFHRFGTGRFWTTEFGNAELSEKDFRNLMTYSPLHNIKEGASYPPLLVTTGDGDDRVVPAHSLKFVAAMLTTASSDNRVLLRYETRAGHGAGKPLSKVLDEQADVFGFLFDTLR